VIVRSVFPSCAIPLFDRAQDHSSIPTNLLNAVARSDGPGRPLGRRASASPLTVASATAGSRFFGSVACLVAAIASIAHPLAAIAGAERPLVGVHSSSTSEGDPFAAFVAEASKRFAVPERWIRAVMRVESGNNPRAISPKGAIGLTQVMPETWDELRIRYNLGADPFDPHDSILAGAAYLREMLDRYGTAGFLAAYNAGPARYDEHLATGNPLPAETIAYLTVLKPLIETGTIAGAVTSRTLAKTWREGPLFIVQGSSMGADARHASRVSAKHLSNLEFLGGVSGLAPRSAGLFVHRVRTESSQ
jgi:soluble lytic murein transglycosylase-like protein